MDRVIGQLRASQSPDPAIRKPAENSILESERNQGWTAMLVQLIHEPGTDDTIKLCAAISLKNTIRKFYDAEEQIIHHDDKRILKNKIVPVMLHSTKVVQSQLCHAITLMAKADFYQDWQELLPGLVRMIGSNAIQANVGVLKIIESITAKYKTTAKTVAMVDEIRYVMKQFGEVWLRCLKEWRVRLCETFRADAPSGGLSDKQAADLRAQTECVSLLVCILYDLICIDWIEFFDETSKEWLHYLRELLQLVDAPRVFGNHDQETAFESLLCNVVMVLRKLAVEYEEEVQGEVSVFVELVAAMVARLGGNERYDRLVAEAIQFLDCIARQSWQRAIFDDDERLKMIVEHILVRNIRLRDSDLQTYDMHPEEWVARDMEGSDLYTRRRVAIDFVRSLADHFEERVCKLVMGYVQRMTQEYRRDKEKNFIAMDIAINLILAISVKAKTQALGATQVREHLPVQQFLQQCINPELTSGGQERDHRNVVKADCLKFVVMFRNKWPQQRFLDLVPLCRNFVQQEDPVLHTYGAIALDRVLSLKAQGRKGAYKYPKEALLKNLEPVIVPLFKVLTTYEESETNQHVMKSILTVARRAQEGMAVVVQNVLAALKTILTRVSKNPQKPIFNHYTFEVIACLILHLGRADRGVIDKFEGALMGTFTEILGTETCTEFYPYVYQIIGLMLNLRPQITDNYRDLFTKMLRPSLWNDDGAILAISGLFAEFFRKVDASKFPDDKRLEGVFGIFEHLIHKRTHDVHAFQVLRSLFQYVPLERMQKYLPGVLRMVFIRLRARKSTALCTNFVLCLATFVLRNGLGPLLKLMDSIQENIFVMVLNSVWLPYARHVQDLVDRRVLTVAMIRMLNHPGFGQNKDLRQCIPRLVNCVVTVFESDPEEEKKSAEQREQDRIKALEAEGFGARFVGLSHARFQQDDPTKGMEDPRKLLVAQVAKVVDGERDRAEWLAGSMEPRCGQTFNEYAVKFGVKFSLPAGPSRNS